LAGVRGVGVGVLEAARPGDWLGLGGWCLLGRAKRLLPEFERAILAVLSMASARGLRHAHLFGVLWLPALGPLLWLADALGIVASVDSSAPVLACTRVDPRKAGCRATHWKANVAWWRETLTGLRESKDIVPTLWPNAPLAGQDTLNNRHAAPVRCGAGLDGVVRLIRFGGRN
jgi:hypothetical protein